MITSMPVVLEGPNLAERHKHFNAIVNSAFQQNIELKAVLQAEEKSPIDKIYKIDLASKYRDVDYILHSLKDDDMLYVCRALKSHWLLEPRYRDVINPRHLEQELFPHMIQPAINKMRHWLQINLKESTRCEEFYAYYKDRHQIAIKFLWHCSNDYILSEMPNVLDKLTPQDLKIVCETCPQAAKVYFEGLNTNKAALSRYLENEISYFKSVQCVLKLNGHLYLDIVEKYFNVSKFVPLSPAATRYIMKNHKDRFKAKLELYFSYILDLKTLASLLTAEESKDLVLRCAKAEYIASSLSYTRVELFIRRINPNERGALIKQVFVEKAYGEKIEDWQYPIPIALKLQTTENNNIFLDKEHSPWKYELHDSDCFKEVAKCGAIGYSCADNSFMRKSPLDILFTLYHYKSFEMAYQDLTRKGLLESSVHGRLNIFLVLVSKSGGVPEQVQKLLKLLTVKHKNEPCNLRAAVIRSLVKRACVWRLPEESWNMFLEFGHDLGLEGHQAAILCPEGLHAVVLRHLINDVPLPTTLQAGFLKNISTLKEYKLNWEERMLVGPRLGKILLDNKPDMFLNILADYKMKIDEIPDAEMILVQKARSDSELACLLFKSRIGRRFLLKETFGFIKNNESFMNALKYDTSVLENGNSFANLVSHKRPRHDKFLQSLALYFNEPNGLADQHKASLLNAMKKRPRPWFARTVNILSTNNSFHDLLKELADMEINEIRKVHLAEAFKATAHKCRPMVDIKSLDWRWLGAKAVANRVLVCRETERESNIKSLLQWRRTAGIAIRLGLASKSSTETFIAASKLRPAVALKIASKTLLKDKFIDPLAWEVIKTLMKRFITENKNIEFLRELKVNNSVPENIKSEYWQILYTALLKIDKREAMPILCRLEDILPSVNKEFVTSIVNTFLNELSYTQFLDDNIRMQDTVLYIRIVAEHLLTCTSQEEQEERLANICDVFFVKMNIFHETLKDQDHIYMLTEFMFVFVRAMKYNKAFLNDKYVSSVPVFERVLLNLEEAFPISHYFDLHIKMHLIVMYYKSLKQSMEEKPNVFENLEHNMIEAIETVGMKLGRNIGIQSKVLSDKYYFSVIGIYKHVLLRYLDEFNQSCGNNPIKAPVLYGLLSLKQTETLLLAHFVLNHSISEVPDSCRKTIMTDLKLFNDEIVNYTMFGNK